MQQLKANRRQAELSSLGTYDDGLTQNMHLLWKRFINDGWVSNNDFDYRYYTAYGTFQQLRQVVTVDPKILGAFNNTKLLLGSNLQYDRYSMSSSVISDCENQSILSAYSQWQQNLNKKFILRVGARTAHLQSESKWIFV